jgi:DNA-binding response OmpR family regulator
MSKILVVEDAAAVSDVVEHTLAREGMVVATTSNGEKALEHLNGSELFDLVILDIMLPGMDGVSVCQELRKGGSPSAAAPVIMLTARDDETSMVVSVWRSAPTIT